MNLIIILLLFPILYSCNKCDHSDVKTECLCEDVLEECESILKYDKRRLYGGMESITVNDSFGTILAMAFANSREHDLCDFWDVETDPIKRKLYVFSILLISSKLENPIRDDLYPLCRIYLREDGELREEEIKEVIRNRSQYASLFLQFIEDIIEDTPDGTMIEDVWVEPLKERNPQDPFPTREKHSMGMVDAIELLNYKIQFCKRLELDPHCRFTLDSNRDSKSVHYGLE